MKAVRFHQHGGPEVLRYEDAPTPTAGPGEVLLRVAGSAFNPADTGIRGGTLPFPVTLPHVPGYDVSGTVEVLGEGVDTFAVGDAVIGFLPMTAPGSAAELAVAPVTSLVAAPTRIPLADAAALPSTALTAWQALFDEGELTEGQRVLIVGAGGTVGGYAVQLAAQAGAHVIATASPRSRTAVAAAGAHEVIDHATTDPRDAVTEPVDLLLNLAPLEPETFASLVALVKDGGAVVSTTAWMPTPDDAARGVRAATVYVRASTERLAQLVERVDAGTFRIDVARRVPLADLPAIHAENAAGTLRGKVVATPASA